VNTPASPPVVAFQGEPGAYSQQACRQFFGEDVQTLPCRAFPDLFGAVYDHRASHIMLPVENSLAGTVLPAYDLLIDHDLRVQGEERVKVDHCLLAPPGTPLADIRRVISHPQALAQCAGTLNRLGIEPVTWYDTAGAARDLAQQRDPHTAALASALAGQIYGLEVLARDVQDFPHNVTRFFVLGSSDAPRHDPSKSSIIFTTRHEPGALHHVLGELANRGINLTKIESRPRRNLPWHYHFYVDFEGHEDDPAVREAVLGILKRTSFLKVLGSYPAWRKSADI
jgi:prephenate dehydratase